MEQIPRIYHMRCTDITSPSTPNGKWYCIKSRQCNVPNVHYFHYSKKFMVNSWMLVRWWNGDCDVTGEGGDSNWLDVSKAKILVVSSSDKSGLSNGQTTTVKAFVRPGP